MVESGHLFVGFYLPRRQIARAHAENLLVVDLGGYGIAAYLADFMLAILTKLRTQQAVTITMMFVLRQSASRDDQHARRQYKAHECAAVDHSNTPSCNVDGMMPPSGEKSVIDTIGSGIAGAVQA